MKAKNVISFLLVMVLILAIAYISAFDVKIGNIEVPSTFDKEKGIKQGLDLVGGSIIVFEPDVKDLSKVTSDEMGAAESIIRARLDAAGYSEATISRQGDTGIRVAELYRAFGCRVLGYSRSEREAARKAGVEYVPFDRLLAESDIVSVHTPLTDATRGLIGADAVSKMKPGAILINTARGPVVDSAAVAEALKSGRLAALGTDVFEVEPPVAEDHPFFGAPNVVATPHVAFATVESIDRRAVITFDNVEKWLAGTLQNKML